MDYEYFDDFDKFILNILDFWGSLEAATNLGQQ